jgi:hypothetical protein
MARRPVTLSRQQFQRTPAAKKGNYKNYLSYVQRVRPVRQAQTRAQVATRAYQQAVQQQRRPAAPTPRPYQRAVIDPGLQPQARETFFNQYMPVLRQLSAPDPWADQVYSPDELAGMAGKYSQQWTAPALDMARGERDVFDTGHPWQPNVKTSTGAANKYGSSSSSQSISWGQPPKNPYDTTVGTLISGIPKTAQANFGDMYKGETDKAQLRQKRTSDLADYFAKVSDAYDKLEYGKATKRQSFQGDMLGLATRDVQYREKLNQDTRYKNAKLKQDASYKTRTLKQRAYQLQNAAQTAAYRANVYGQRSADTTAQGNVRLQQGNVRLGQSSFRNALSAKRYGLSVGNQNLSKRRLDLSTQTHQDAHQNTVADNKRAANQAALSRLKARQATFSKGVGFAQKGAYTKIADPGSPKFGQYQQAPRNSMAKRVNAYYLGQGVTNPQRRAQLTDRTLKAAGYVSSNKRKQPPKGRRPKAPVRRGSILSGRP